MYVARTIKPASRSSTQMEPFFQPRSRSEDHALSLQVIDDRKDQVSVPAQQRRSGSKLVEQPEQPGERRPFQELITRLDREPPLIGERSHRLDAPDGRAAQDPSDGLVREHPHERLGLALSGFRERSGEIVAGPRFPVACLRMTEEVGRCIPGDQRVEDLPILGRSSAPSEPQRG